VSADIDLGRYLKAGDQIVFGHGCGEPSTLVEALIAQGAGIGNLSAFIASSFSGAFMPESAKAFSLTSIGAIGRLRTMAQASALSIIPCHIGQVGPMIASGLIRCDVAMIQVGPADAQGNHSLGLSSDHVLDVVAKARVVIAEVNDQLPFTYGLSIPASQIDVALHTSRPPVALQPSTIGATDDAIARHATQFVEDGAVLQMGVGSVPDAIVAQLKDRKDLGLHSGMLGDGMVALAEAGVLTNARKEIDAGVSVTGLLIGSQRLFDFCDRNPAVAMRDADYVLSEAALTRLTRLMSINSAIEVDLTGQVNAEGSGSAYMGGTGGQVDFVRAASRSPGGHSIIALCATAKGGSISKIVPVLSGPVTTARAEVDIIVTEFGAAELKGQTLAERARRLTAIAHPDFREALDRAAFEIARRGF
jgi:acyl-CoA hydrolase